MCGEIVTLRPFDTLRKGKKSDAKITNTIKPACGLSQCISFIIGDCPCCKINGRH